MAEYIDREAFVADKRAHYCDNCDRRKGMKNGKMRFVYDIGDAPCRACGVDDMMGDIEDYPAADVVEVVRCKDCKHYKEGWCYNPNTYDDEKTCGNTTPDWYCADGAKMEGRS